MGCKICKEATNVVYVYFFNTRDNKKQDFKGELRKPLILCAECADRLFEYSAGGVFYLNDRGFLHKYELFKLSEVAHLFTEDISMLAVN